MDCFCGWRNSGDTLHVSSASAYDPKQPMTLYAAAGGQVFITANGGEEWQAVGSPGDEVSALAHSPSGVLYALLGDGRVAQSRDKGSQWEGGDGWRTDAGHRSEEHTSELQSLMRISYAVFGLKKKRQIHIT